MKVKFSVGHEGETPATALLKLFGKTRDCACVECTAARIAHEGPSTLDAEQTAEFYSRSFLKALETVNEAKEAFATACSRSTFRVIDPAFLRIALRRRLDEYNTLVRSVWDMFPFLSERERAELGVENLPELLSWEEAMQHCDRIREEIAAAVERHKAQMTVEQVGNEVANELGTTLAQVVNEARKAGASNEEITAVIRNAATVAKDSMREAIPEPAATVSP